MHISYTFENYQEPVEQQTPGGMTQPDQSLWVLNPTLVTGGSNGTTGSIWDSDDMYRFIAEGMLAPGESFTVSKDVIADMTDHFVGIKVFCNTRSQFTASIAFSTSESVSAVQRVVDRQIIGKAGILTPIYQPTSPELLPIPGSNGGIGKHVLVTWTVTNTGTKAASFGMDGEICLAISNQEAPYFWGN